MEMPSRMGKGQRKGTEKVKGEHAQWMQRLQGGGGGSLALGGRVGFPLVEMGWAGLQGTAV